MFEEFSESDDDSSDDKGHDQGVEPRFCEPCEDGGDDLRLRFDECRMPGKRKKG
eukprot:gene9758-4923_t